MTMAAAWSAFPYDNAAYRYDAAALAARWPALHAGDAEPLPADVRVLAAWSLFHAGDFEQAVRAGLRAAAEGAPGGMTVANKAQLVYASYLEPSERTKIAMFHEVAARSIAHRAPAAAPRRALRTRRGAGALHAEPERLESADARHGEPHQDGA